MRYLYQKCVHAGGILEQSWEAQLLELEGRLARSGAQWKLVVGHHPVHAQLQACPMPCASC